MIKKLPIEKCDHPEESRHYNPIEDKAFCSQCNDAGYYFTKKTDLAFDCALKINETIEEINKMQEPKKVCPRCEGRGEVFDNQILTYSLCPICNGTKMNKEIK